MDGIHATVDPDDLARGDEPLIGPDGQLYTLAPDYLRAWERELRRLWYAAERAEYAEAKLSKWAADLSALLAERGVYTAHHCRQAGYLAFRAWREGGYRAEEWVDVLDDEGTPEPL